MATNSTQELIDSISNIVGGDNNISYLKNSICSGNFFTKKGFVIERCGIGKSMVDNGCWVRLTRISKVNLKKFIEWKSGVHSYYTDRRLDASGYFGIFNPQYQTRRVNNLFWMGCNIDKDLKLSGYSYNVCDVYNSYDMEHGRNESNSYSRYIYKFLFIGNKNFIIGFIDKDCILYLDTNLIESIMIANHDKYVEVIKKIFSVYSIVNMSFFDGNMSGLESQITEYLLRKYLKNIKSVATDVTFIKPDELDIFSDDDTCGRIISKLSQNIRKEIEDMIENTSWGINNQYSYNSLVAKLIRNKDETRKIEIEKAFSKGLLYGNKFELCGWTVCDNFKYSDDVAWMKEVNIVPSRVVFNGKLYNINNSDDSWTNPYKITTIYVTIQGKMWCDGVHPNVSSGQVCMGDISQKISLGDPTTLGENLNKCEALLTLINYDSAYTSDNRELIIEHSTLDITNSSAIDTEYVGENEVLTDISFEDDEEENESVEGCEEVQEDGNVEGD